MGTYIAQRPVNRAHHSVPQYLFIYTVQRRQLHVWGPRWWPNTVSNLIACTHRVLGLQHSPPRKDIWLLTACLTLLRQCQSHSCSASRLSGEVDQHRAFEECPTKGRCPRAHRRCMNRWLRAHPYRVCVFPTCHTSSVDRGCCSPICGRLSPVNSRG